MNICRFVVGTRNRIWQTFNIKIEYVKRRWNDWVRPNQTRPEKGRGLKKFQNFADIKYGSHQERLPLTCRASSHVKNRCPTSRRFFVIDGIIICIRDVNIEGRKKTDATSINTEKDWVPILQIYKDHLIRAFFVNSPFLLGTSQNVILNLRLPIVPIIQLRLGPNGYRTNYPSCLFYRQGIQRGFSPFIPRGIFSPVIFSFLTYP